MFGRLGRRGALLAASLLLACASDGPAKREVLMGNPADTILVLPLNVTAVLPPELEERGERVWDAVTEYLEAHGKQLKTVAQSDARRIWLASIRKARLAGQGSDAGYRDAARLFVQQLARHADFDAVVAPSLFLRTATIVGQEASWDDVSRPVEFEARRSGDEPPHEVEGQAPAASLHVTVLDAEGELIQEKLTGLELLARVRVLRAPTDGSPGRFDFVTRTDLFSERTRMYEGVSEALAPFLPRLPPPDDPGESGSLEAP